MSPLCNGRWPDLQTLVLARNCLGAHVHATAQSCQARLATSGVSESERLSSMCSRLAGLCAGHWPSLLTSDLSYNGLDEVSMTHMVKSMWPELKCLYLGNKFLNDAGVKVLSHNYWHKLECLDLRFNVFLMQDAASLLSIEQRRVAVFYVSA